MKAMLCFIFLVVLIGDVFPQEVLRECKKKFLVHHLISLYNL